MLNVVLACFLFFTTLCTATLLLHLLASAAVPKERIALMLTGSDCREAQQTLVAALRQTDGVFAVDGDSVPGHLLIDVEEGEISAQDTLTIARTALGSALSCQIKIMQSCITASKHTGAPAPAR
ncbi:MAG: hypothetical protein ABIR36_08245 [Nitrospiraceae bacterium]